MLGFFKNSSGNSQSKHAFQKDDIKQLLETFTIADTTQLIPSSSGSSLVVPKAATEVLESWYKQNSGRKSLEDFAKQLDIDAKDVYRLPIEMKWGVISTKPYHLLSLKEEIRVYEALVKESQNYFVNITEFCQQEGIPSGDVSKIVSHVEPKDQKSDILWFPLEENEKSSYITSPQLESKLHGKISKLIAEEHDFTLDITDFLGLDAFSSLEYCKQLQKRLAQPSGIFKLEGNQISYISEQSFIEKRQKAIQTLASGDVPFIKITELIGDLPGQFASEEQAVEYISKEVSQTPSDFQLTLPYLLSKSWVHNLVMDLHVYALKRKYANPSDTISKLPKALQSSARSSLLIELEKQSKDLVVVVEWVVARQQIRLMEQWSKDNASRIAHDLWQKGDAERPKPTSVVTSVKTGLFKEFRNQSFRQDVLELVLKSDQIKLDSTILEAWNSTINELEIDSDEQFRKFWVQRIVNKSRLYVRAWSCLDDGLLKDQLSELLQSQLIVDVSQAVNRANTRKLLQSQRLKIGNRVKKLQENIQASKGISSTLQELEKFNQKVEIEQYSEEELASVALNHVREMAQSMTKDEDGARLFISLLLILWSRQSQGVLYATGKFAPKILKALKPKLEPAQAELLDKTKEAVKTGNVSPEMKEEMRQMALKAVE